MIAALIAASLLAGCSGKADPASAGAPEDTASVSEHGSAVSVTYSRAGGANIEDTFSYRAAQEEEGYLFSYLYYDYVEGRLEGEREIGKDDMDALRAIVGKYGYAGKVGQRAAPDFGNDEETGAASYYLAITFEDGKSMTADTAGDGGAELESFFRTLAEKDN